MRPIIREALISDCGTYRYTLTRRWGDGHALPFIMLNPSVADAQVDDRTIRRCIGYAKRENYAAIVVLNLYAYRSPDPKALLRCDDPVGPDNDAHLNAYLSTARLGHELVIAAWGVNARPERVQRVFELGRGADWRCLGTTKNGHPRHPLYLRADQPLLPLQVGP